MQGPCAAMDIPAAPLQLALLNHGITPNQPEQTIMATQTSTPTTAVVVTHEVSDFDTWKTAFDRHAGARQKAGITRTHINRHADAPNLLSVYMGGTDAAALDAFLSSQELMAAMRDAGVKGPPQIAKVTPVEDKTQKTGQLAGVIVRHEVKDYDTWKAAFDAHAGARAGAGIVGHAINRSRANPNVVVAYLQAQSQGKLEAFLSAPDLKQTMQKAGVVGAPDVTFVQEGEWSN